MVLLINSDNRAVNRALIDDMHCDRKRVFVDRLGWDVPTEGAFERDQFDGPDAEYLVVEDARRGHLGSVRLLSTETPHLLDTLFEDLCDVRIPRGAQVREISRLCFAPKCRGGEYSQVRDRLTSSLVEYALLSGIRTYTLVVGMSVYSGVLAQGWRCTPLGMPRFMLGEELGALRIDVDSDTIPRLREAGTYRSGALTVSHTLSSIAA